jgi:ribonuclease Z
MCEDPSLLIHECTNAALPEGIQRGEKGRLVRVGGLSQSLVEKKEKQSGEPLGREKKDGIYEAGDDTDMNEDAARAARNERESEEIEKVRKKANGRGHSIPQDVGLFARKIRARRLVVNHFSAMYVKIPPLRHAADGIIGFRLHGSPPADPFLHLPRLHPPSPFPRPSPSHSLAIKTCQPYLSRPQNYIRVL